MDEFGSQGLSDADFADVMSRAVPEGGVPTPVETPLPVSDPAPSAPVAGVPAADPTPPMVAAQPDGVVAAPEAAESDASQSSPADPAPTPETPVWNSPDNPYYQQASQMQGVMQAAQLYAQQQQQLENQQNFAREQAAAQELARRLPDMEPDEQQVALQSILGWQAKNYQGQLAQKTNQLESAAAFITYQHLDQEHKLNPQQSAKMRTIHNAEMAEMYARSCAEARTEYQQQLERDKAAFQQANLQGRAQDRIASGVDTVGGGGTGAPASMATAENMEDFFAAIDREVQFSSSRR